MNTESGVVDIANQSRGDVAEFDITTKSGTITVDGTIIDALSYSVRSNSEDKQFSYKIKTGSANVNYTNTVDVNPETETEAETENAEG